MQSLHDGDVLGVWFCLSSPAWRAALPLSTALLLLHVVRGEGLGGLEAACYLLAIGGLSTELFKIIRAVTGGGG